MHEKMKLYGTYTSPFVRHCRMVLLETGQACEFIEADAATSAKESPTKRVPYFIDKEGPKGELLLSDSSAIIKYLREKNDQPFLADIEDFNLYCLANTLLDSALNIFFLEKDELDKSASKYLQRQHRRIENGLKELNKLTLSMQEPYLDSEIRLACFLDWALFRERISLENYPQLQQFLDAFRSTENFIATQPPAGA